MAFLGYLTFNDDNPIEYALFGILTIVNIIKWLTTPRKD